MSHRGLVLVPEARLRQRAVALTLALMTQSSGLVLGLCPWCGFFVSLKLKHKILNNITGNNTLVYSYKNLRKTASGSI